MAINYKYTVCDEEAKIKQKDFDNFAEALDYAKQGLITSIYEAVMEDDMIQDDPEVVWTWDDYRSDADAIDDVAARHIEPDVEEDFRIEFEKGKNGVDVSVEGDDAPELMRFARSVLGDNFDAFTCDFDDCCVDEQPTEIVPADFDYEVSEPSVKDDEEYVDPFDGDYDASPEEDIPEESKDLVKEIEKTPADSKQMDMVNGKLVPAKNPKDPEVDVDECYGQSLVECGDFDDFDIGPQSDELDPSAFEAEQEYLNDLESGAFDDEQDYNNPDSIPDATEEDMSEAVFYNKVGKAMAERHKSKLDEAGFFTKAKNKILSKGNEITGRGLFGKGEDNVDKVFKDFVLYWYDMHGKKKTPAKPFTDSENNFQHAANTARVRSEEPDVKEVYVVAERLNPEYEELFQKAYSDLKLPLVLRLYRKGKIIKDTIGELNKRVKNTKFEVENNLGGEATDIDAVDLQIKKEPYNKDVVKGRRISLKGLVLKCTRDDGTVEDVDGGWEFYEPEDGIAPNKLGEFEAVIGYAGKTVELTLNCIDHELTDAEKWRRDRDAKRKAELDAEEQKKQGAEEPANKKEEPAEGDKPAAQEKEKVKKPRPAAAQYNLVDDDEATLRKSTNKAALLKWKDAINDNEDAQVLDADGEIVDED